MGARETKRALLRVIRNSVEPFLPPDYRRETDLSLLTSLAVAPKIMLTMACEAIEAMSKAVDRRAKLFRVGKVLLALAVLPWVAWVTWMGKNDPSENPLAHHHWVTRIEVSFAAGVLISLIALICLLFGRGWRRVIAATMALCLFLFYAATMLAGD